MERKYFVLTACVISALLFLFSFAGALQAQCTSDADCDDGVFCNGTERCLEGNCGAVSACPPFIDGCVIRGGECDEANDVCRDVPDDSMCDPGQICDVITGECIAGYSATANAEAVSQGPSSLTGSGVFNEIALLFIPVGVVILLKVIRRKK